MKDISNRLSAAAEDDLTKLIVQMSDYIFKKETTIKKGVENIMLNKPYMLESERLFLEGEKKGFEQGEVQGRRNLIANALKRGQPQSS